MGSPGCRHHSNLCAGALHIRDGNDILQFRYKARYEEAAADAKCFYDEIIGMKKRSCENCGNGYCMFRPEGNELRYNCHLWVQKEQEHDD